MLALLERFNLWLVIYLEKENFEEIISKITDEEWDKGEFDCWASEGYDSLEMERYAKSCLRRFSAQLEKQILERKESHHRLGMEELKRKDSSRELLILHTSQEKEDESILGILKAEKTKK